MALTDVLKVGATGLTGMFAGAAFYINATEIPATKTLDDIVPARKHWKEAYLRARWYQGGMAMAASTAAGIVYFLDDESGSRVWWLVGSGLIFTVLPFTKLVMASDINKNLKDDVLETAGLIFTVLPFTKLVMASDINKHLKDDVLETAGETWVRNHILRWNKQHMYRTVVSVSAFGVFLYALSRK